MISHRLGNLPNEGEERAKGVIEIGIIATRFGDHSTQFGITVRACNAQCVKLTDRLA